MQPSGGKYALFRVWIPIIPPSLLHPSLRHSGETTLLKHELMKLQLTSLLRAVKLFHPSYQLKSVASSLSKFCLALCRHKASSAPEWPSDAKRGAYRFTCIARWKREQRGKRGKIMRACTISCVRKRIESCRRSSCLKASDLHRCNTMARVMRY